MGGGRNLALWPRRVSLLETHGLLDFSRADCLAALSATGPTFARNSFSCARVRISTACFSDTHFTDLMSSIGSRLGPPMARICQNCTILIRPSTEYNIEPRNPWTETSCPVSSNTSRLAQQAQAHLDRACP